MKVFIELIKFNFINKTRSYRLTVYKVLCNYLGAKKCHGLGVNGFHS
jgi:hypothetical protein